MPNFAFRPGQVDIFRRNLIIKTGDENVANSTFQDDNTFQGIELLAGVTYAIQAHFAFDANADGGGVKIAFITSQAVVTSSFYVSGVDASRTVAADSYNTVTSTTAMSLAFTEFDDSAQPTFFVNGSIEANASTDGTLKLQWANNSGTNTLTHKKNSWLMVERAL
jgi:hypothetical protein